MAEKTQSNKTTPPDPAAVALAVEMGDPNVQSPESRKAADTDAPAGTVPTPVSQSSPPVEDEDTSDVDKEFEDFSKEFETASEPPPSEPKAQEPPKDMVAPPATPAKPADAQIPPASAPAAAAVPPPAVPVPSQVEPPKLPDGSQPVVNLFDVLENVPQSPAQVPAQPAAPAQPATPAVPSASPPQPEAPSAVPVSPPVSPAAAQDPVKLREEYIESYLVPQYSVSEQDARALMVEPEKVLPRLLSKVHVDVLEAAVAGIAQQLPNLVSAVIRNREVQVETTKQFFGRWPQLAKTEYVPTIQNTLKAYRQMHPQKPINELIDEAGATVMLALRVPFDNSGGKPPATPSAPPPAVRPLGPAGRSISKPGGGNAFEQFAEELIAEDQVSED